MGIREGIREFLSGYSKDDSDYPSNYQQYQALTSPYGRNTPLPVIEMKVPLCCDKCERKVRQALEDCVGVKDVICDREKNRVTVTGFVDPYKALRRVKKIKPKSDLHGDNTYINRTSIPTVHSLPSRIPDTTRYVTNPLIRTQYPGDYVDRYPYDAGKVHYVAPPPLTAPRPLVRVNSWGRMNRMPSFSRAERYDNRRHDDLVPLDLQRDFYGIRRMPSFQRHRYHDAEYISMGDEYTPAIPETRYVSLYDQRPADVYRRQISFSRLPVTNPYYHKHIEHESNY